MEMYILVAGLSALVVTVGIIFGLIHASRNERCTYDARIKTGHVPDESDEISIANPEITEPKIRRGGGLIIGGGVLVVSAIVGILINYIIISNLARSGSYGSGSMASLYFEADRLNKLTAIEGTIDIVMGVVILIGLGLLIKGIIQLSRTKKN